MIGGADEDCISVRHAGAITTTAKQAAMMWRRVGGRGGRHNSHLASCLR
jgi:hypothetical protein